MKKIITLLFAVGAFATSFAQYNHHQNNDGNQYVNSSGNGNYNRDDKDWRHFNRGNIYSSNSRDFQIAKINRDFDFRIQSILHDRYLRRREKKAAIRNAEKQRSAQIQMVNERFNCYR